MSTTPAFSTCGKKIVNALPTPGVLERCISPPDCLTIPCTVDNPRPVPLPTAFVVKNGSKMRSRVAMSMPVPVSVTVRLSHTPFAYPSTQSGDFS